MKLMKLPILPCAEKLELVLSTALVGYGQPMTGKVVEREFFGLEWKNGKVIRTMKVAATASVNWGESENLFDEVNQEVHCRGSMMHRPIEISDL